MKNTDIIEIREEITVMQHTAPLPSRAGFFSSLCLVLNVLSDNISAFSPEILLYERSLIPQIGNQTSLLLKSA